MAVYTSSQAVEEACGIRYRVEVSDLGLGVTAQAMQTKLASWGYDVEAWACRMWLGRYRFGNGAKGGNAAVYALSLRDLQSWYYVENLKGAALVDKYRAETCVVAHQSNLTRWLEALAQKLPVFKNNEDTHTHECGEYVLQELQSGVSPEVGKEKLLS